jgi:hypothetical protein
MSTPPRRPSTVHLADYVNRQSRLFAAPKERTRKECNFLKLFYWRKQEGKGNRLAEISPLLLEHAALYHNCEEAGCNTIIINVAGQIYETQLKTLRRFPDTLLGSSVKRAKFWDAERKEYFFDRHRPSFDAILNFYQNGGRLRRPMVVPEDVFQDEIKFFELGDDIVDKYREEEGYLENPTSDMPEGNCMRFFWRMFAGSTSSIVARCMGLWSMFVTSLSIVMVCVETLPKYHDRGCKEGITIDPATVGELAALFLTETTCVLWFCIELTIRFSTDPDKKNFFKKLMNIIDAVTILPYPGTVIEWQYYSHCQAENIAKYVAVFSILKFIRIIRVFKLCRYIQGLRLLIITISKSTTELILFLCFVTGMMVIYAAGIYYAEATGHGSRFTSIPEAFWWAVVSLTTVGYGDYVPENPAGKLVGTICITTGILVVAFPVPVLVANFTKYYRHQTGKILTDW